MEVFLNAKAVRQRAKATGMKDEVGENSTMVSSITGKP